VALTQFIPSGWEIINTRFTDYDSDNSKWDYADIRDDRANIYFGLKAGETKRFTLKLNASYKGQYSPTSPKGFVSKSSPFGTVEKAFEPAAITMGAGGTFFARMLDVDFEAARVVLPAAHSHKGASVVECLVNCVIFNNGTHSAISSKEARAEHTIFLEHGKPIKPHQWGGW